MMIANKEFENKTINKVEEYILQKEDCETTELFWGDNHLQICDEDLYNFVDLTFTIASEYKYETAEDICKKVVDEIYNIIQRHNNNCSTEERIYTHDLSFIDMMKIYNTYSTLPLSKQRKAKIKHGLI